MSNKTRAVFEPLEIVVAIVQLTTFETQKQLDSTFVGNLWIVSTILEPVPKDETHSASEFFMDLRVHFKAFPRPVEYTTDVVIS